MRSVGSGQASPAQASVVVGANTLKLVSCAAVGYHTNARAKVIAFYREMLVHSYIQNYFTHCCSSVSAISVITSHPSTVSLLFHTTARRAAPDNMQSN